MPQQVGHLYSWLRGRDMRLYHPWPSRLAPACCPKIVPDDCIFRPSMVSTRGPFDIALNDKECSESLPAIPCRTGSHPARAVNKNAPPSGASLFMAERQGFEPWNTREDVTGIPVQRLRPLGHLSINLIVVQQIAGRRRFDWNSSSALLRTSMCSAPWGRLSSFARQSFKFASRRT